MAANPFPPPFYSIKRTGYRSLSQQVGNQGSGNTPPQSSGCVLIAIGSTPGQKSGLCLRLKPTRVGTY